MIFIRNFKNLKMRQKEIFNKSQKKKKLNYSNGKNNMMILKRNFN